MQQGVVLVQAEALIPRGAVGGAVIQAVEFAGELGKCAKLWVALLGCLQGREGVLQMGNLRAVAGEGQQHADAPDQGEPQGQPISHPRCRPAETPTAPPLSTKNPGPRRLMGPVIALCFLTAGQRQAEPQPAQRNAGGVPTEQRCQSLAPTGNAFDLQVPRQAQQEVVISTLGQRHPAFLAQRLDQGLQRIFQGLRAGFFRQRTAHRLGQRRLL